MAEVGEKKYALSSEILGHSADVRAVSCVLLGGESREHIVTGSRDGTACVWRPDPSSSTEYLLHKVIRKHTGYVSALCVVPADPQAGRYERESLLYLVRTSCKLQQLARIRTQTLVVLCRKTSKACQQQIPCSSAGYREPRCDHLGALSLARSEAATGEIHGAPGPGDHHHLPT